jgi:hypothetical protein
MAAKTSVRLAFGPNKYAALHLLLCRWLRLYGDRGNKYCYVTLGGTELRDISSLGFADISLASSVWSYETNAKRFEMAKDSAVELASCGIEVDLRHATVWSHNRQSDLPHIFFIDLQGICAWGDYDSRFGEMFQNEIIREGDCLLITSHLGHNPGPAAIREHFGGEFAVLGIDDNNDALVRSVFRRAHPTMTLFKALCLNGIQSELALRCFGTVKYRDGAPMGIYGYAVAAGKTELATFVGDSITNYFDIGKGRLCKSDKF